MRLRRLLILPVAALGLAVFAPQGQALYTPHDCHSAQIVGPGGIVNTQMNPTTNKLNFNIIVFNKEAAKGIWRLNVLVDGVKREGHTGYYNKGNYHGSIPGRFLGPGKEHIVWINGTIRAVGVKRGKPHVFFTRISAICSTRPDAPNPDRE